MVRIVTHYSAVNQPTSQPFHKLLITCSTRFAYCLFIVKGMFMYSKNMSREVKSDLLNK